MLVPEQLQSGIIDGYVNWIAPPRKEAATPQEVPFAQHSGNERYPTHKVDHGDFQIAAIPFLRNKFNAAAWLNGTTHLLAREVVDLQAITDDTPDVGRIVSFTMDEDKVVTPEQVIWTPGDTPGYLLEDPRAVDLGVSDGRVALGLTAVAVPTKSDDYGNLLFYPARAFVDRTHPTAPENLEVITEFGPGKNMMSLNVPGEKNNWWVFRPEGSEHELLLLYDNSEKFRAVGKLPLPKNLLGFGFRAGTSAPPVWENEQKGIFPFHGMEKERLYTYSQGVAIIERGTSQEQPFSLINPVATLHPDHFNTLRGEDPMELELHPRIRRSIYTTGAVVIGDTLRSLVSVGDTATVVIDQNLPALINRVSPKNREVVIYPSLLTA